jgi:peptide deformylase
MILPIRIYGDPVLREETTPVAEVTPELKQLAADMIETMRGADGVGLAAPQIGHTERLFVVDVTAMLEREPPGGGPYPPQPMIFVNPEIVWESEEETSFEEGCLSIPDVRETVWRPARVRLQYLDLDGQAQELEAAGVLARVIQHEYDHLEGVLFLDHLTAFRRRMLQRRLRAIAGGDVTAEYPIQTA